MGRATAEATRNVTASWRKGQEAPQLFQYNPKFRLVDNIHYKMHTYRPPNATLDSGLPVVASILLNTGAEPLVPPLLPTDLFSDATKTQ